MILLADQLRGGELGCTGNPLGVTPHIDVLADRGVVVEHCYANSPVCCPNRANLLTGTYPLRHGVIGNDLPLPSDVNLTSEVFADAGYRTGYIGKWHLDGVPRSKYTPPGPRRHGFQYWAAYNCTHDYFSPKYYTDTPQLITQLGYEPEVQTDLAIEFLDALDPSAAFMLVLSWGPPHDPYDQVPERYKSQVHLDGYQPPPNLAHPEGEETATRIYHDYLAGVRALDEQVSRLVARLHELDRFDDTITVFTSDHGDMLGAHGWVGKQMPYEESIGVPLIVTWPDGLPAGARREGLMATVDLSPTLLGLAEIPDAEQRDGTNRSRLLREGGAGADEIYIQNITRFDEAIKSRKPEWRGLRTDRWTYAETPGRRPWLLFDNANDSSQQVNLATSAAHRDVRDELQGKLGRYLAATGDPFLPTLDMVERLGLTRAWTARENAGTYVLPT